MNLSNTGHKIRSPEAALQNMRTRLENILPNEDHSNNLEDGANCWAADQLDKVVSNVVEDSNKEEVRQMTIDLHAKGLPETVCY